MCNGDCVYNFHSTLTGIHRSHDCPDEGSLELCLELSVSRRLPESRLAGLIPISVVSASVTEFHRESGEQCDCRNDHRSSGRLGYSVRPKVIQEITIVADSRGKHAILYYE